ncbi:hypothetical protein RI129_008745 [Pyrocoelia pectoralis]|uniref:FHA domain-containing protein n=1 Tax=Pyrocoelia pectoralis TaxID=417401 RepID=A0AAN7ZKE6_9COLE
MYFILIGKNDARFYLLPHTTYTVGRKDPCNILITNDESISRKHAVLTVTKEEITITDSGSRYGTFVNETRLKTNASTVLREGYTVKFGMFQSIYKLQTMSVVNTTSGIKSEHKTQLKNNMNILGGLMVQNWTEQCNYVTVEEMMLTVKVLSALVVGVPIVCVKYWDDYVNCLKENKPVPDVKEYQPKCSEVVINENVSLEYREERKNLFKNKVFVFPKKGDKEKIASLIKLAGGESVSWDVHPLSIDKIGNDQLAEYIVMQTNNINDSIKQNKELEDFINHYTSAGNRTVPLQEIALAVINCSCEKDCNPKFNRKAYVFKTSTQKDIRSQVFLAMPTQSMELNTELIDLKNETIIPQSFDNDLHVPNKIEIIDKSLENKLTEDKKVVIEIDDSLPLKRESDSTHNERDCKRIKVDESSINFRDNESTSQERKQDVNPKPTSPKSLFAFNNTNIATDNLNSIVHNNPFTRKRKADADGELNLSKKPSQMDGTTSSSPSASGKKVINPFSNLFRSNNVPQRENLETSKVTSTPKKKSNEKVPKKNENSLEIDFSAISVVNNDLEKSFQWITKSTMKSCLADCINDQKDDTDQDMLLFINSFRDAIIIQTEDMVVHKRKKVVFEKNVCGSNVTNYKKFKKVQPLRVQKTIIPESKYVSVICSNNNECEYVQELVEDETDNMDSEPIQARPIGRQYVF